MSESFKFTMSELLKYIFGALISILGFLLVNQWNGNQNQLSSIQADLVSIKLQLVELDAKTLDENRVREICRDEFHNLMKLK